MRIWAVSALCLCAAVGCTRREPGPKREVAFRLSDATIVYEEALKVSPKWGFGTPAVDDFRKALSKATGADIRAVPESNATAAVKFPIYVGDTLAARAAGFDPLDFRNAEMCIRVEKDRAFLFGKTGFAAAYAAAEFLKRFAGYRYVTMNGNDPCAADPSRRPAVGTIRRMPAVYHMQNSFWSSEFKEMNPVRTDWFKRMHAYTGDVESDYRVSEFPDFCHTQFNYVPPAKYAKDHPEYYLLGTDGKRHADKNGGQLCYSNPDVFRIALESMLGFIAKEKKAHPKDPARIFDFTQMDCSPHFCACPACTATAKKHDRKGGRTDGGDAGLQLEFVNRLAREVARRHPDVLIRTFAYVSSEEPPVGIVPEDNVIVWLCDLYSRSCHDLPLTHPFNAHRLELLRAWKKLAKRIQLWDYTLYGDSSSGDFPDLFVDATVSDARTFRDLGIDRVYIENHDYLQPFYELNTYVQAEFMADPDQDLEVLLDDYCRVYGKGAAKMREAIDFLRDAIRTNPPKDGGAWHWRSLPWRTVETWEGFVAICRAAYDAEGRGEARERIAAVLASATKDLVRLYKLDAARRGRVDGAVKAYVKYANEALDLGRAKGADLARERQLVKDYPGLVTLKFNRLPPELKDVPEDELLLFDFRSAFIPKDSNHVAHDPDSECEKSVRWKPVPGSPEFTVPKTSFRARLWNDPKIDLRPPDDGQYHWYRLFTGELKRGAWLEVATEVFLLSSVYIECDGLATNPNRYEFWLSAKLKGKSNSPDMTDGFFVDRLVLRRLK